MSGEVSDITIILERMEQGDPRAAADLLQLVYAELRRLASHKMAGESPGQTLQATALVHEAWIRLGGDQQPAWKNRAHFFFAAAEAMRRILVENARRKKRLKHGGHLRQVDLDEVDVPSPAPDEDLLAMDEALGRLAGIDSRAAQLVKLRFFLGMTQEESARQIGISVSTAERTWAFARAWLFREIQRQRDLSV
jgi:RNA polymerase sigma factor (TIGR02999 family)